MWLSAKLLAVERFAVAGFMFLLTGLILLNVVTRYSGVSLYWVDESAIYSVVFLSFIGASAMTRLRLDFAVTMLTERFSARGVRIAKVIATSIVLLFGTTLLWLCVLWLDPVGMAVAGFDARALAAKTFNFIYTERTQTLNWPVWALYMIMPVFALSMMVHSAANLLEDLELVPRVTLTSSPYALGLRLPLTQTVNSSQTLIDIANSGTGADAHFEEKLDVGGPSAGTIRVLYGASQLTAAQLATTASGNASLSLLGASRSALFDMNNGFGNTSVQLPTDAVSSAEIYDEPGVASNTAGTVGSLALGAFQDMLTRTIVPPNAGYCLVIATLQCDVTHTNGTIDACAFPQRAGSPAVISAFCATFTSDETAALKSDTSMRAPFPVFSRA